MVMGSLSQEAEVVVVGGGPGGYVAAIRAADLGKEVLLVEEKARRGGTCLLEGCIPSKTLVHAVELIATAREAEKIGISYSEPTIDLPKLRAWTESVVDGLSTGIDTLLRRRGIEVIQGRARFDSARHVSIQGSDVSGVDYRQAIIATGSRVTTVPGLDGEGIWTSTDALALREVPARLLVIGGGYIGLELGLVYAGLGSEVTVVDQNPNLLAGVDPDLVAIMMKSAEKRFHQVLRGVKVRGIDKSGERFVTTIELDGKQSSIETDAVLVAVGRKPNSNELGLHALGVEVNSRGFIPTDELCRTNVPNIYAIGDVTPGPMLAHKASREGKVAAEVIAGENAAFDNRSIPAVVFTDPEIAWAGLTELEAKAQGLDYHIGKFPLTALGRARTLGRTDGQVKVISEPSTNRLLGVGMVGVNASELIAEASLALEMGATLEDLIVTIHPHPTLSESLMEAAEVAAGSPIHLMPKKPAR